LPSIKEFFMQSITDFGRRLVGRPLTSVLALILLASTAQAYTIVLRGGRVVVIPNTFKVTATTITYEVSTGFQVTLQLSAIDIPATDKANREPPGSFQKRLKTPVQVVQRPDLKESSAQDRTVTNRDLESFARKRREGELAYERRRRDLGLPSAEESRRQALAEAELIRERFERNQAEERASEAYWRERAIALKADIAATDAEINSIRQQLDWLPSYNSFNSVTLLTGFGRSRVNRSLFAPDVPRVFVTPQIGPQVRVFGGARVLPGGPAFHRPFPGTAGRRRGFGHPFGFFPGFVGFPYQSYDLSYERTVLVTRLNELVARRAGLAARWRALEEEARRAGAMPGWLRP
jgi:hypothetical protein